MNRAFPYQQPPRAARGVSIVEVTMPLLIGLFTGYASVLRLPPTRMLIGIAVLVALLAVAVSAVTKKEGTSSVASEGAPEQGHT